MNHDAGGLTRKRRNDAVSVDLCPERIDTRKGKGAKAPPPATNHRRLNNISRDVKGQTVCFVPWQVWALLMFLAIIGLIVGVKAISEAD